MSNARAAGGPVRLRAAQRAVRAKFLGVPFELEPRYADTGRGGEVETDASWGRRDFLRHWDLRLSERDGRFSLRWRP